MEKFKVCVLTNNHRSKKLWLLPGEFVGVAREVGKMCPLYIYIPLYLTI
jgi:hypothetical protein